MPHLQQPIELRAQVSRTWRVARLLMLVAFATGLFILGLSLIVLLTTR